GLQTSTVHSSLALVSTMLVPEVKLKLACGGDCGSVCPSGTQLLWCGAGSLANATLSAWVMPSDTALPAPVKSAGRPISPIAAAHASIAAAPNPRQTFDTPQASARQAGRVPMQRRDRTLIV